MKGTTTTRDDEIAHGTVRSSSSAARVDARCSDDCGAFDTAGMCVADTSRYGLSRQLTLCCSPSLRPIWCNAWLQLAVVVLAAYPPNEFLGTCLDQAWVEKVEADLSISRFDRDSQGRLVHPHLHAALKNRRFNVRPRCFHSVPSSGCFSQGCWWV